MIEDVQAQLDAAEDAASQPKTDPPPNEAPPNDPDDTPSPDDADPDGGDTNDAADPDGNAAAGPEPQPGSAAQPNGFSKALQNTQQEIGNLGRKLDVLVSQIQNQGGKATPEQAQQAQAMKDRMADLDAMLSGEFDSFEHAKPAFKTLVEEIRDLRKQNQEMGARLQQREAHDQALTAQSHYERQVEAFWKGQPAEARTAFDAKVTELQGKGYQGERLQGALDAWWDTYTPPAAAQKDPKSDAAPAAGATAAAKPNTPPHPSAGKTAPSRPAQTTPGGARVVPSNTGVRPQPKPKSAKERIAAGDVDFFGGRYGPR
jgi:hypothetical protein